MEFLLGYFISLITVFGLCATSHDCRHPKQFLIGHAVLYVIFSLPCLIHIYGQ